MKYRALPKNNFKIDKDEVLRLYLSQNFYEWAEFAKFNSFNPECKNQFPFAEWQSIWLESKTHQIVSMTSSIKVEAKSAFCEKTLSTLKGVSELNQTIFNIANIKTKNALQNPDSISTKELCDLARVASIITDTSIKEMALFSHIDIMLEGFSKKFTNAPEAADQGAGWRIVVDDNGEPLTKEQWSQFLDKYLDKPIPTQINGNFHE